MLLELSINSLAIIKDAQISFHQGLTMITGQTGSGKSLIIAAIDLLLGGRASLDVVRADAKTLTLNAHINISHNLKAKEFLNKHQCFNGEICKISRTISHTKPSKSSINGKSFPLSLIKKLKGYLITIYNQHTNTELLSEQTQQALFDSYANNTDLLTTLEKITLAYNKNLQAIQAIKKNKIEISQETELLTYQIGELNLLGGDKQHIKDTLADYCLSQNAQQRYQEVHQAWQALAGESNSNTLEQLYAVVNQLEKTTQLDETLLPLSQSISSLYYELESVSDDIRSYVEKINIDSQSHHQLSELMNTINELARKHQCQPEELPNVARTLKERLTTLNNPEIKIQALNEVNAKLKKQYQTLANNISQNRLKASKPFTKYVKNYVQKLGMSYADFLIELTKNSLDTLLPTGMESVSFRLRANLGQNWTNLADTISGGELSRVNLAIASLLNQQSTTTLIFDEIDNGISGSVAQVFGGVLKKLSTKQQVICITHLPQVASYGDAHLMVDKKQVGNQSLSKIVLLSHQQKITELARMIDGIKTSTAAQQVAEGLINQSLNN